MKSEFSCGVEDFSSHLPVLQERWPRAFPVKAHDVRPLAVGAADEIAAAMGWSVAYTRGVLCRWKMGPVYCRAVIWNDRRIALDGTPAEPVDAEGREMAAKRLAAYTARKAAKVKPAEPAKPGSAHPPARRGRPRPGSVRRAKKAAKPAEAVSKRLGEILVESGEASP